MHRHWLPCLALALAACGAHPDALRAALARRHLDRHCMARGDRGSYHDWVGIEITCFAARLPEPEQGRRGHG
jgi:hypothetical protein